jgi:hypothetical protein
MGLGIRISNNLLGSLAIYYSNLGNKCEGVYGGLFVPIEMIHLQ